MPTNFAGVDFSPIAVSIPPFAVSTDVAGASFSATIGLHLGSSAIAAANRATFITSSAARNLSGRMVEAFGGQLFERLIMNPLTENLGFVITDTQFAVEPWNTSRNLGQILTAINVIGTGDLTVSNPYPFPTFYAALDSRVYQVLVSKTGAPSINEEICFAFQSGVSGTCILVTGNRIVLFSAPIDWDYGTKEKISYLTNVLASYSNSEQRRALRQLPRRGASFRAKGMTAREAAGIESQIWGWQNEPYGVPWWPDVSPLLADAAPGSLTLQVKTTDFQFAVGGIAAIWTDEFTFEAVSITGMTSSSISLGSPTQQNWKAGPTTLVMPVFLARLGDTVDIQRLFSGADQMDLEFSGEAQQVAPTPAVSLTQYKGFDVLEIPANWPTDLKRKYSRKLIHIDPGVGPITVIDKGGSAITSQPFPWLMLNHSQVTTLRGFFLARLGKLFPFWIPTWDQDLIMSQDAVLGDSGIKIKSEFYTRFMFPNNARRYLALIPFDLSGTVYRKITSSVDNGDGTETLGFDATLPKAFPAAHTMVSFLVFARLDSDDVEIEWLNNDLAQTTLEMTEVPNEAPA
jgi:hypothetical protein